MDLGTQNMQTYSKVARDSGLQKILKLLGIKEKAHTLTEEENLRDELIQGIKHAREEWVSANTNFEYANDSEMIDYYTYKIKACQVRYEYLIKKAKENGIRIEMLESIGSPLNLNEIRR